MTITDAVRTAFRNYAVFSGRATRKEFWSFLLVAGLLIGVSAVLAVGLAALVWMTLIVPYWSAMARRLHDTGRSGWMFWVCAVPYVGAFVLLYWLAQPSQQGDNQYGRDPRSGDHGTLEMTPIGVRPAVARAALAELLQLRSAGLISDDEYAARRASVLGLRPTADPAEPSTGVMPDPTSATLAARPLPATKDCPDCAETVLAAARLCRFCRHEFPVPADAGLPAPVAPRPEDARSFVAHDAQAAVVHRRYAGEWRVIFASSRSDLEPGVQVEIVVAGERMSIAQLGGDAERRPLVLDLDAVTVTGNSSDTALSVDGKPLLTLEWWDGEDGDRLIGSVRQRPRHQSPAVAMAG